MKVIPAIDLMHGKVVRLVQGRSENVIYYNLDPLETAKGFEKMGAEKIHIVDLEGAFEGKSVHAELILKIKKNVKCELQAGGGLRKIEDAERLLQEGVDYVMVASLAFRDPQGFERLTSAYPHRVILSLDVKGGKVVTGGWLKNEGKTAEEVVKNFSHLPLAGVLHTDTERDGTLEGINVERIKKFLDASPFPVIVAGGVGSDSDIEALAELNHPNLEGVVVGRAYYEGRVNLEKFLKRR